MQNRDKIDFEELARELECMAAEIRGGPNSHVADRLKTLAAQMRQDIAQSIMRSLTKI